MESFSEVYKNNIGLVTRVNIKVKTIGEIRHLNCERVFLSQTMQLSKKKN